MGGCHYDKFTELEYMRKNVDDFRLALDSIQGGCFKTGKEYLVFLTDREFTGRLNH